MARSLFAVALLLPVSVSLLHAAGRKKPVIPSGDPAVGVSITWYGHSCFLLADSAGRAYLIDPYHETVGYELLPWKSITSQKYLAVLMTHEHFDHAALTPPQYFEVLKGTSSVGSQQVLQTTVTVVPSFHDNRKGAAFGWNHILLWEMAGMKFAHMGDFGEDQLSPEQKEALSSVDVLFIPVGGVTTIDGKTAANFVEELRPRVVIPMHYMTERLRFYPFEPVRPFLARFDRVENPANTFSLRQSDLPEETTIFCPAIPSPKSEKP